MVHQLLPQWSNPVLNEINRKRGFRRRTHSSIIAAQDGLLVVCRETLFQRIKDCLARGMPANEASNVWAKAGAGDCNDRV